MKLTEKSYRWRAAGPVLVFAVAVLVLLAYAPLGFSRQAQPRAGTPAPQPGQGAPGGQAMPGRRGAAPVDYDDHTGFVSLFNGTDLTGWLSDGTHWSVKDGAIYANSTCENPTGTIYIYSNIGEVGDFELRVRMKGTGNVNSGVQYRSWLVEDINAPTFPRMGRGPGGPGGGRGPGGAPGAGGRGAAGFAGRGRGPQCANPGTPPSRESEAKWDMGGPQYDFDNGNNFPGQFYEQHGRGIIAFPGQVVEADPGVPPRLVSVLADPDTVKSWYKKDDWNEETIIARGHVYTHILNGHLASEFIDNDPLYFQSKGHIGFEIESTGEIFIKDIWLKRYE
jgi:hypothetical protein